MFLIVFFPTKLCAQDNSGKELHNKYLMFSDTGYVIYMHPHFTGLFVSTADTSLTDALKKNAYLPYLRTESDDFRDFMLESDTMPAFIKRNENIDIYSAGRLDKRTIDYCQGFDDALPIYVAR